MTQAAVDFAKLQNDQGEFRDIQYIPKKKKTITCEVSDTVTLKLKNTKNGVTVMIWNASKFVTLNDKTFKFICDLQEQIRFLVSFLEQQ